NYLSAIRTSFIIQELIDLPFEFGVFYRRYPNEPSGIVTSIVMKEMLTIYGDGHSTFEELIMANERARLQWHALKEKYRDRLNTVLRNGEVVELVSIGNHCLGTKFLDGSHLITDELCSSFDRISRQIPDFYFGRYDLRSEEHTSELQSRENLVCRLLLEKKNDKTTHVRVHNRL